MNPNEFTIKLFMQNLKSEIVEIEDRASRLYNAYHRELINAKMKNETYNRLKAMLNELEEEKYADEESNKVWQKMKIIQRLCRNAYKRIQSKKASEEELQMNMQKYKLLNNRYLQLIDELLQAEDKHREEVQRNLSQSL